RPLIVARSGPTSHAGPPSIPCGSLAIFGRIFQPHPTVRSYVEATDFIEATAPALSSRAVLARSSPDLTGHEARRRREDGLGWPWKAGRCGADAAPADGRRQLPPVAALGHGASGEPPADVARVRDAQLALHEGESLHGHAPDELARARRPDGPLAGIHE